MSVPLLDLKAQYQSIRDEVENATRRVFTSQRFVLGPEGEALEREVAAFCRANSAVGISSGTDALLAALMALGVGPGDEVVTTPYTFFATAGSIRRLGAIPVFVDIEPLTYNINPDRIESVITDRTRALLPVHLYGQMADMKPILTIASRHSLPVIEDAAQAIGAEYEGDRSGSFGELACFSFFPSKNLGGAGDGGMVVAQDTELATKVRQLRNHGETSKYHHEILGGNFRLDELQAAVLRVKLRHLDRWNQRRRDNVRMYRRLFEEAGLLESGNSAPVQGIQLPVEVASRRHVYHQFVVRTPDRDQLVEHLKRRGIGCGIYYPIPLHLQPCFSDLGYQKGDFPEAETAAGETIALPIYPELNENQMREVVQTIRQFWRK